MRRGLLNGWEVSLSYTMPNIPASQHHRHWAGTWLVRYQIILLDCLMTQTDLCTGRRVNEPRRAAVGPRQKKQKETHSTRKQWRRNRRFRRFNEPGPPSFWRDTKIKQENDRPTWSLGFGPRVTLLGTCIVHSHALALEDGHAELSGRRYSKTVTRMRESFLFCWEYF